ncbi:MAG: helix-hairpin-helix domain-containing protein [Proteobacteria bacterium]|nr:helix-hairpin-helix domain-containing protein [Pseudomonadota bacterium]MBU1650201.1 helix-hairpin-helix domain-containing protein [Pseudomonadota bacterium]
MPATKREQPVQLENLPNIGKAIAADLRRIGIVHPDQLARREPLAIYRELSEVMGRRLDPCLLYTLLSVKHFLDGGEALPWWNFTAEGKILLKSSEKGSQP